MACFVFPKRRALLTHAVLLASVLAACGGPAYSDDDDDDSSGGASAAGDEPRAGSPGTDGSAGDEAAGAGGVDVANGGAGDVTGTGGTAGSAVQAAGSTSVGGSAGQVAASGGSAGVGGSGIGGASAAGNGAGGAGGAAPQCRTYWKSYTFDSSLGAHYGADCTHSEDSGFIITCTGSLPDVKRYASRADFIEEGRALGLTMRVSERINSSEETFTYDAQGRLTSSEVAGVTTTYDSWDDVGRPLHAVFDNYCADAMTIAYTETTIDENAQGGSCSFHYTLTFDSDGIETFIDYGDGTTATYTTSERTTVCR